MLPIDFSLGDAAAAEEMVKQITRTQRPDQIAQDEIFERRLSLAREESRLASVHPTLAVDKISPILRANNPQSRKKRQRRFASTLQLLLRERPSVIHEVQPLLFNIFPDHAIEGYHETDVHPEMGQFVDWTI